MNNRPQPTRSPWRRIPLAGWLGVLLLAFSVAGTVWVLHSHASDGGSRVASPPPESSGQRVVCQGHGDVPGGVVSLYPLQPGEVSEVLVQENEEVEAKTVLFKLEDTLQQLQLREARKALEAAEEKRDEARRLEEQHAAQRDAQAAAVKAKKEELEVARQTRDEAKRLFDKQLGPSEEKMKAVEANVRALEAVVQVEEAKLRVIDAVDPKAALRSAQIDVDAKKLLIQKAEYAVEKCIVRAPRKGTVLRMLVSPGEMLGPNPRQPAVLFCPSGPRIVRAEVEQEYADRVVLNQSASIQDADHPKGTWRGKVTRIADWYTQRRSIMPEPLQFSDVRTLECIVELEPNQPPLKIGQRVRVTLGN
jgi:multidrug resistance efflux pump